MIVRGAIAALLMFAAAAPTVAQEEKQPPYWASIASTQAMTHTGPGRNYPGVWLYQRRDLPVRVLKKYQTWRMIQDPGGAEGWMLATMLSDRRTAIVRPGDPRPVYAAPDRSSHVRYLLQSGVVGRIDHCRSGWCRISVGRRRGYIRTADIWGVGDNEVVD